MRSPEEKGKCGDDKDYYQNHKQDSSTDNTKYEPYRFMDLGAVCPQNEIINEVDECKRALEYLEAPNSDIKWNGSANSIPSGCSYRPAGQDHPNQAHFNKDQSNNGRGDLQPVCKN